MFIAIALIICTVILFIFFYDWLQSSLRLTKAVQKNLSQVSQLISLGMWEEAKKLLEPLLAKKKGGKETLLYEVQILYGSSYFNEALEKAFSASREYPEELLFRLEEGKILLKLERVKEALRAFNVCMPIIRAESDILAYGRAFLKNGQQKKCLGLIEYFLNNTQNGELTALAADCYYELKNYPLAIKNFSRSLELGWKTHQVCIGLGHCYRRFGNLSAAEQIFRELLEKDPRDVDATLGIGACLAERGHYQKALLFYQTVPSWETKSPLLLKQAAVFAIFCQKYELAASYLENVFKNETPDIKFLAYYGYCLERQKKWMRAENIYRELVHRFPSCSQGYLALAWMFGVGLSSSLSKEEGLGFAHIALKQQNSPLSWEILSACEARVGNFDKAYQIQQSLALHDKDVERRKRRQSALRKLRHCLPLDDSEVLKGLVA